MHLFVNNLTNVDFSYLDAERGLVGETWLASIVLEGALDEQGMVCDFGIVKKTLRHWLDDVIDHCLIIPKHSTHLNINNNTAMVDIDWQYSGHKTIHCQSPQQAITFVDAEAITPESVAYWCIEQLRQQLPDTIDKISLSFVPETIAHHAYHYSHGLKKHLGNCQRIAHGHRSTIEIFQNEQRNHTLEAEWCQQWGDIYIGTHEDLVQEQNIQNERYYVFHYQAQQGEFSLTLPAANCYLIDTESTVEFIAQHIADTLKQQYPKYHFKVKAFEGIGKGAIALA